MANLVLACVYGSRHVPFVHTFIYSVQESCPGTRIIIGYSDFPDFERKILEVTYPEVFFQKLELDKIVISTHAAKASLKTKLWHELLMKNVSIGDDAVFLDIDTIMVASPFAVFENCGDLALTRRPGKWPLNSGVIFVKKSEMTLNFFEKWNLTTESIINSKALNREAEVSNGGADQHAIIELLNLSKIIRDEDSDFCYNEAFRIEIKLLECSKYNQTESVPFDDEIKIIHFKAGWHEILLANTKYTRNRPASTSKELHNLWRGYYAKSKLKLYKAIYDESWLDDEISSAVARIQYEERGIYNSELVLVCSMLKIFGINHILESGRARGHSTIVLSEFLQTTLNSKVISIDFEKNIDTDFSEKRLQRYKNTILKYGHANSIASEIINREIPLGSNYAVLLDGPKSINALYLTTRLIRKTHSPSMVFIHDMRRYEGGGKPSFHRFLCETIFDRVFFSDNFEISEKVVFVDQSVFTQKAKNPHTANAPYRKNFLPTGSYGPTLAVILPTKQDTGGIRSLLLWPILNALESYKQLIRFVIQGKILRVTSHFKIRK